MVVKLVSDLCLREAGRGFIISLKASNHYQAVCRIVLRLQTPVSQGRFQRAQYGTTQQGRGFRSNGPGVQRYQDHQALVEHVGSVTMGSPAPSIAAVRALLE